MKILKHPFPVTEMRVIDGDTLEAWVQVSDEIRQLWRIRLKGVEGGEMPSDNGLRARFTLDSFIAIAPFGVSVFVGNPKEKDQFGRHVGDIQMPDGKFLTSLLLQSGVFWLRERNGTEHKGERGEVASKTSCK